MCNHHRMVPSCSIYHRNIPTATSPTTHNLTLYHKLYQFGIIPCLTRGHTLVNSCILHPDWVDSQCSIRQEHEARLQVVVVNLLALFAPCNFRCRDTTSFAWHLDRVAHDHCVGKLVLGNARRHCEVEKKKSLRLVYIIGFTQDCSIFSAYPLELPQSCAQLFLLSGATMVHFLHSVTNERRHYISNIFSHWLNEKQHWPIDSKWAQISPINIWACFWG